MSPADAPICPYCGQEAAYQESSSPPYREDYGPIWICVGCKAWVGCRQDGQPAGRLADAPLRKAKQAAHAMFDPLVQRKIDKEQCAKHVARTAGYEWLAKQLAIPVHDCHIAMFDLGLCLRTIDVCRRHHLDQGQAAPRQERMKV